MNKPRDEFANEKMPRPELDWVSKFLIWVAGAQRQILLTQCPEDIPKVLAQAGLLVGTFIYSSVVLSVIGTRLLAADHFSFGLVLGAIGISALVGAADAYVFLHCSWLKEGAIELKKMGWVIPMLASQRHRMNLFLVNRFTLALGWAYMIGLCAGLILYQPDVRTRIDANYLKANAPIVAEVSRPYDAEIKSQAEAVTVQEGSVKALAKQTASLRQSEVNRILYAKKRRQEPVVDGHAAPFEVRLEQEQAKLDAAKKRLAELVQGRNTAIRKAVDSAPNHVPFSDGFLAQVSALDEIASENGKVAFLTTVLEVVAVGIEMAAVLAKLLGFNPTAYSAIIARAYYTRLKRISGGPAAKLDSDPPGDQQAPPSNDNDPLGDIRFPANDNVFPEQPAKRGPGRPRGSKTRRRPNGPGFPDAWGG